jgi:hypothetical protein
MENRKNHNFRNKTETANGSLDLQNQLPSKVESRITALFRLFETVTIIADLASPNRFHCKPFVASVAEWRIFAVFAIAEPDFLLFC